MDRRTIAAVVLSIAVYYGWLLLRGPQLTEESVQGQTDGVVAEAPDSEDPSADPANPVGAVPIPEPAPSDLPIRQLAFEACNATGTVTTNGGVLRDLVLNAHAAPYLVNPLYSWIPGLVTGASELPWRPYGDEPGAAQLLSEDARAIAVGSGPFGAAPPVMAVVSDAPDRLVLEGQTANGLIVRQTFTGDGDPSDPACTFDVEVTWTNPGASTYDGPLWVGIHDHVSQGSSGMLARYSSTRQPLAYADDDLWYGGPTGAGCIGESTQVTDETGPIAVEGKVSWFGLSERYFGFYVLPETEDLGTAWFSNLGAGEGALGGAHIQIDASLASGGSRTERFTTYIGPNDRDVLAMVDEDLAEAVDLGWFALFGYPLLGMLKFFQSGVGNWGVAIILLTLLVKLAFFPMTQKSFRSMQKMQALQPELQRIREEYADNPQEMNQRTFAVMSENKVNPVSGCLPMFIQFPVWIALYNVLLTSTDLYHTQFLYLRDLSEPDPYCILPIGVMVLMLLQQRFSTPANMDPVQQRVMKLMPLFFGLLFFAFPSGLAVYVFVNMVLSILQQWLIKRSIDQDGMASPAAATAK